MFSQKFSSTPSPRCWWRRVRRHHRAQSGASALFLVLAFFTSAAIWLLLEAEFLAIVLVLVYVGAVMVLFLFVVMMLDVNIEELRKGFTRYAPLGGARGDRHDGRDHQRHLGEAPRSAGDHREPADAGRITATPRRSVRSCTPSMSIRSRSRR